MRQSPMTAKHFGQSFGFALSGLTYAFQSEANFRTHCALSVLVLVFGFGVGLAPWEWAILLVCIALMLATELINTAIERCVDRFCDVKMDTAAGQVKDLAAGACLVVAFSCFCIGILIFVPHLTGIFQTESSSVQRVR